MEGMLGLENEDSIIQTCEISFLIVAWSKFRVVLTVEFYCICTFTQGLRCHLTGVSTLEIETSMPVCMQSYSWPHLQHDDHVECKTIE